MVWNKTRKGLLLGMLVLSSCAAFGSDASAQTAGGRKAAGEPGWTHGVVRVGEERDQIKSLPMTERPYRPLHFYGNTVRRMHYRGTAIPAPRDIVGASAATILRK